MIHCSKYTCNLGLILFIILNPSSDSPWIDRMSYWKIKAIKMNKSPELDMNDIK